MSVGVSMEGEHGDTTDYVLLFWDLTPTSHVNAMAEF